MADLSKSFCLLFESYVSVLQPQHASMLVWPVPFSLSATKGIAFAFSSCGYWDVSVRRVFLEHSYVFTIFIISDQGYWVPPFGNLRIIAYLQLPGAYRCSSRPSAAPSAKASAVRSYSLNLSVKGINIYIAFFYFYSHCNKLTINRLYIFLGVVSFKYSK